MSRYRPISVKVWGDDRFRMLSKPQPNGQTLWFYLLTGDHTTPLPGAFVAGESALAEALKWPGQAFRKAFGEVLTLGMAEVDRDTRLIFLPKAVRHNPPQSLNAVKGWRKAFDELPDCPLKQRIFDVTVENLRWLGVTDGFVNAFGEAYVYALPQAILYPEQNISEHNRNRTEQNRREQGEGEGTGEGGTAAPPSPGLTSEPSQLRFGSFGWARVTESERTTLLGKMGSTQLDYYINRFDRFVQEDPEAKTKTGKKRKDRNCYLSILNWFDQDVREGKAHAAHQNGSVSGGAEAPGSTSERRTKSGDPIYIAKQ